jgi:hypothetical protein
MMASAIEAARRTLAGKMHAPGLAGLLGRARPALKSSNTRAEAGAAFTQHGLSAMRTKRVYGIARHRYTVNRPGRTSLNVFEKINKLNRLVFDSLVDIEGVTGSIPVAPTTQPSQTPRFRQGAK